MTVDYLLWPLSLPFVMDKIQLFYHIKQNAMRKHILKSIEDGVMTAFPSSAVDILRLYFPTYQQ